MWIVFLVYPIGIVPFTYGTSFLFNKESIAQTMTIFIHFLFSGIGGIVVFVLRVIPSTLSIGKLLMWVLKLIPSFCLTNSVIISSGIDSLTASDQELSGVLLDTENMGGDISFLILHFVFWSIVIILIESRIFSCFMGIKVGKQF